MHVDDGRAADAAEWPEHLSGAILPLPNPHL